MNVSREREQELATTLQVTREALFAMLTPEEMKTRRKRGSSEPWTFEDSAKAISESDDPRAAEVGAKLRAFQAALNALWVYAVEVSIPEMLTHAWQKKHRGYGWIETDLVQAEAVCALRHFIIRFNPGNGNLHAYAYRGVHQHLTEWAPQQGSVQIPQRAARNPGSFEVEYDDEKHGETIDFEHVINEALDEGAEEESQ